MGVRQHPEREIDTVVGVHRLRIGPASHISPKVRGDFVVWTATHVADDLLLGHGVRVGFEGFHLGCRFGM